MSPNIAQAVGNGKSTKGKQLTKVHATATAARGREEKSTYKYIPTTTPGNQKNILRVLR